MRFAPQWLDCMAAGGLAFHLGKLRALYDSIRLSAGDLASSIACSCNSAVKQDRRGKVEEPDMKVAFQLRFGMTSREIQKKPTRQTGSRE